MWSGSPAQNHRMYAAIDKARYILARRIKQGII